MNGTMQGIVETGTQVGKLSRAANPMRLKLEGLEVEEIKRSGPGGSYLLATSPDGRKTLYAPSNRMIGPREDISVHINDEPWQSVKEVALGIGADEAGVIFNFAVNPKNTHEPTRNFDGITSVFLPESVMKALSGDNSGVVTRTAKAWRLIVTPTWSAWAGRIASSGGLVDYWSWHKGASAPF